MRQPRERGASARAGEESRAIDEWLLGDAAPTFRQAQKLAKHLRVPFGYLFLEEPPDEAVPVPDFRRHPDSADLSLDLRDVISDVLRKQDWYRDHRTIGEEGPGDIEAYCNRVAGELLLPWRALAGRWRQRKVAFEDWAGQIARELHVSTAMVARQLWQHAAIDPDQMRTFSSRRGTGTTASTLYPPFGAWLDGQAEAGEVASTDMNLRRTQGGGDDLAGRVKAQRDLMFRIPSSSQLVANAVGHLVTQETPAEASRKRVKIPDACRHLGVQYENTFEMMRALGARFG